MNLANVREKLMIFLIPICIVIVILGSGVALIGQTYFWNVSRLIVQIPEESQLEVRLDIQARVIYFDADFFGFYYPVHITLPYTKTQTCLRECFFDRLPAGDGILTFAGKEAPERTRVFITPDTQGILDLRPEFTTVLLNQSQEKTLQIPYSISGEVPKIPGTIEYTNNIQGLIITIHKNQVFLYDALTKQSFLLPVANIPFHVARAEEEGQYFLYINESILLWDRYGRIPIQALTNTELRGYTFSWSKTAETSITQSGGEVILSGFWTPIYNEKDMLITSGREIREIRQ